MEEVGRKGAVSWGRNLDMHSCSSGVSIVCLWWFKWTQEYQEHKDGYRDLSWFKLGPTSSI